MKRIIVAVSISLFLTAAVYGEVTGYSGQTWKNVTSGIDEMEFYGISVAGDGPDIAYVATGGGVYSSSNSGMSWKKSLYLGGGRAKANFVLIDPRDSKVVYAATDKGLYRTRNSGRDWGRAFSGLDAKRIVRCIALDPADPDRIYIGTEAGLFRSENHGRGWIRSGGSLGKSRVRQIAINPTEPRLVYGVSDKGLFRSDDRGVNWGEVFTYIGRNEDNNTDEALTEDEAADVFPLVRSVVIDPVNTHKIYLGTKEGIFESCDGGIAWQQFTDEGLISKNINFLEISPIAPFRMYAATQKGVFGFFKDENAWLELYPDGGLKEVKFVTCDLDENDSVWIAAENGIYKTAKEIDEMELARLKTHELFDHFRDEPTIHEIQEAAIRYGEVHPKKIARWRRAAKGRAFLPRLNFGIDKSRSDTYEIYTSSSRQYYILGPDDETEGWDINLTWDLGDLIWNEDQTQIDVRSKLMAQLRDDILDEVNRYYFERRKLQIELLEAPPKDTRSRVRKELRLQEITANIDALTGSYLSKHLEK